MIDEVFEFLGFKKINKSKSRDNGESFYRGVSDKTYRIKPSVFRGDVDENKLYHLIFRNHFSEFVGMKPIEILAIRQKDTDENFEYFIDELLKIDEVRKML